MAEIAELGFKIDSSALLTLTEQLDRCTASAHTLKAALDGLGDGIANVELRAVGEVTVIKINHIAVKSTERSPEQSPASPDDRELKDLGIL